MTSTSSPKRAGRAPVRRSGGFGFAAARNVRTPLRRENSGDLRSAAESGGDPLSATVPHPQRRTGVLHMSRRVSGGAATPRGRNRLAGGVFSGCRGRGVSLPGGGARAGLGETPTGFSPEGPARTGAPLRCRTGAIPARQRRAPARRISFGRLGECLGRQVCVPFLSVKGVWRWAPIQMLPSRPPLNRPRLKSARNPAKRPIATRARLRPQA